MELSFYPKGVCSRQINLIIEDNKIIAMEAVGGCSGNLQGISKLVEGMSVDEVISRLDGIRCGYKSTSCPDQLAQALKAYKEKA